MQVLDFDFEKFCSISLTNLNVYACLVCGKYYQGRGHKSHAYTHSLEAGHHVYINLKTEKVYCLPDGYEINDPSLDDIRHVLNPRFVLCFLYLWHTSYMKYITWSQCVTLISTSICMPCMLCVRSCCFFGSFVLLYKQCFFVDFFWFTYVGLPRNKLNS